MSVFDRAKNKFNEIVGHVEEVVGGAVGDKAMEMHGDAKEDLAEAREEQIEGKEDGDPDDGVNAKV